MTTLEEMNKHRWRYRFIGEGYSDEWNETEYPGDVFIDIEDTFGCGDFAMDMLAWCENSKPGDRYVDEDFEVECL